jgi:hypothetical protein
MDDEERADRARLWIRLVDMSEEINELKAALTILLKMFAGSAMGNSLLALALSELKKAPDDAATRSAALIFSDALLTKKSK